MAGTSLIQIEAQFRVDNDFTFADLPYFHDILHGVHANLTEIDTALAPCLDLTIEELDPVELCVMRLSTWELLKRVDVPYRVVLNEAIETAKRFGSEHGHTYINGVLDHAAVEWRPAEAQARR